MSPTVDIYIKKKNINEMNIGWPAIILFCSVCSNLPGYKGLSQLIYRVYGHGGNYVGGMYLMLFFISVYVTHIRVS